MIERRFHTFLDASPSQIWESVTTLEAINHELMPYLSMHSVDGTARLDDLQSADGVRSLDVTMRLANLVPLGITAIRIVEFDRHRFVEESRQPGMHFWRHERIVEEAQNSVRLTDILRFEPTRLPAISTKAVDILFRHRHQRLDARWNHRIGRGQ